MTFVGRDGLVWQLRRHRGHSLMVGVFDHESDCSTGGQVVHGLSKMVRGTANNPVPLWPAEPSWSKPSAAKRNPLFRQD